MHISISAVASINLLVLLNFQLGPWPERTMRNTCGLCDQSDQQQRGQSSRDLQLVLWEASVSLVRTAGHHRELILREVKCPVLVKLVTKIIVKITHFHGRAEGEMRETWHHHLRLVCVVSRPASCRELCHPHSDLVLVRPSSGDWETGLLLVRTITPFLLTLEW